MSLVPDGKAGTRLVVSSRYADASVVVIATPEAETCAFGAIAAPVVINGVQLTQLTKALAEQVSSRLIDVELQDEDAVVSLVVTNAALVAKNHSGGVKTLELHDMAELAHKPLMVDGFRPQVVGSVTRDQLVQLYKGGLEDWKAATAKAAQKVAQLRFATGKITYALAGQPDVVTSCNLELQGSEALNLRTRDLHDLVQAVLNEDAKSVTLAADTGGMLRLAWSDRFGTYEVYLPTATASGELSSRRLEPMRVSVLARAA